MSAITGVFYWDGSRVANSQIDLMIQEVAHRGPDGSGVWCDGSVGLGQRMLWTTPESLHEQLPLVNKAANLALTADARIDNRDELIAVLNLNSRPAREITDSELILAAYEKWDEQCTERLVGDFAFAIWDGRKQTVFCARDHFGVRPFYYHLSSRMFAFGTEIKALLCLSDVPRRLNEAQVAEHLSGLIGDNRSTFYRDIVKLPPGHALTVGRQDVRLWSYSSFDLHKELRLKSDAEYAEAFREQLTQAVRCRLRSAFPVGSMLSGGLDSSSITCTAQDLLHQEGKSLHTFSVIFDKVTECDERPFINAVLAKNGVSPHFLHGDQSGPFFSLDQVFKQSEGASVPGNLHYTWRLYGGPVREQGVRVILDGHDGDTTVSHGVGRLIELARDRRWLTLARETHGYSKHFENCPTLPVVWWHIQKYGLNPGTKKIVRPVQRLTRGLKWRTRHLLDSSTGEAGWRAFVNQDFVTRINLFGLHKEMRARNSPGPIVNERSFHYNRLIAAGMTNALEMLNKASGAFGLEVRFPFWDDRLARFCLSLPAEQKLSGGWNRVIMRRAMNVLLPPKVQWRGGKMDMTPSFEYGLRTFGAANLKEAIEEYLESVAVYVDTTALRQAYRRFCNRQSTPADNMALWKSVSLALWLRTAKLTP
jgi:asparagine synthase (glutamine-hydrolysing)